MPESLPTPRTCNPCTLCCSAPAIAPLNKPAATPCSFLSTSPAAPGCSVYHQREDRKFDDCRSFQCLWIQGHYADDDRPDRLGVIFSAKPDPDAPAQHPTRDRIYVTEQTAGAANHPRVQELIRLHLAQQQTVAITNPSAVIALQPTGHAWIYKIDPTDPLRARIDPAIRPIPLTIRGHKIDAKRRPNEQ